MLFMQAAYIRNLVESLGGPKSQSLQHGIVLCLLGGNFN